MEEAYGTAGLAVSRLVCDASGNRQYLESEAALRHVLRRRPVVLGYVVSTLAAKLQGAMHVGNQPSSLAISPPHAGICSALVAILASYDPSTPHSIAAVINALGEERLKVILHAAGTGALSLPWAPRLCLLHACHAEIDSRSDRRWRWLPTVADSICSQALQALTKQGRSSGKGKGDRQVPACTTTEGRAKVSGIRLSGPLEGVAGDSFSHTVVAKVCSDLAKAGAVSDRPPTRGNFLSGYSQGGDKSSCQHSLANGFLWRERGDDWLQGFRFKLQALRDALLGGEEVRRGGEVEHAQPLGPAIAARRVALRDVYIRNGVVERALERSRCGEAFILAVQSALEVEEMSTVSPDVRKRKYGNKYAGPVKLMNALEVCLFGVGLPAEQGLLDVLVHDLGPDYIEKSSMVMGAAVDTAPVAEKPTARTPTRCASAFLQCLVAEGIRVRDLLMLLLHLRHTYCLSSSSVSREFAVRWPGADAQAPAVVAQIPRDARRLAMAEVVRSLVEWLANTAWAWTFVGSSGASEGWVDDLAAAATAVTTSVPFAAGAPGATAVGSSQLGVQLDGGWRYGGDGKHLEADGPIDLVDRLVAAAAAAVSQAAPNVNWVDILSRVVAIARTDSVSAYAATCVERSVALGGQAPFPVIGGQRLAQAEGQDLCRLLEQSCALREESGTGGTARVVLVRTAAAAIAACREASQSWMVSPGLLSAGPIRLVMDIIHAAQGTVIVSDVLSGLLSRPGGDGPTLTADMFAAIVVSEATMFAGGGPHIAGGCGDSLRSQAVAWLGSALSTTSSFASQTASTTPEHEMAAVSLTSALTRRVPFETKPVLLSIGEAAEVARGNNHGAKARRLSYVESNGGVSRRDAGCAPSSGEDGDGSLEALIQVAQAALESPLLPLPVPSLSPPLPPEKEEHCAAVQRTAKGRPDGGRAMGKEGRKSTVAAPVMAGLILDTFMQTPGAVLRALRANLQRGNCAHDLLAVQRALRVALCTQPGSVGVDMEDNSAASLPPGLGNRRADACLLMGHLVELGVPGWKEAKAAMNPPPHALIEAAEPPAGKDNGRNSRHRISALRLELWLRTFLRDSHADWCHGTGASGDFSAPDEYAAAGELFALPDVFRTAQTLARAVSRQASALIMESDQNGAGASGWANGSVSNGHISTGAAPFHASNGVRLDPLQQRGPDRTNVHTGDSSAQNDCQDTSSFEVPLIPPRRSLIARLRGLPTEAALGNWVSSIVNTAARYRRWLPWQAFSNELRQLLLLLTEKPLPMDAAGGDGRAVCGQVAIVAAIFAVCELLLAWDAGQEISAAVFEPALCSTVLNTALAPVAPGCSPPVWLDVLRCLLDVKKRGLLSRAVALHSVASTQQDSFTLAAAASVWIGGGGPDGLEDENGERSTRQAWIRWYDAELGGLIPTAGTRSGRWLVLSTSAGEDGVELVNVRAGEGWPARTLTDVTWENRGRSPLEAAWNVPAGQSTGSTGGSRLATIVLPPFAAWLRVVLRGDGQRCSETELDGYLRRMAREVYLPCEFGGASNEMARQWLAALIEAEAVAEANTPIDLTTASGACGGGWARQGDVPDSAAIRRAAVTAFFRAELLKFGSGDDAPVAPVGGPLSWLWPLEAVVAACGRAGPLGGGFFRPYLYAKIGVEEGRGVDPLSLNDPPSALARALSSVPYDLLCGSRRFGAGGERPSPATVRAFATRAVDLAARALAAPSCRQWSVARRLLLGLGLLYHALATPEPRAAARAALSGPTSTEPAAIAVPRTGSKARYALDAEEAATARSAALNTIESLLRIAFGMDRAAVDERASASAVSGWQARPASLPLSKPGTSTLPTACRSLRPLEIGGGSGWKHFLKALRGSGAWRTAATLSKPLNVEVINAPPKVPAAQPLTTATTASFRSRRQSLPTRWKTDDAEREIKRSALPPATHDDSGFHIETSEKNTGASTAKPGSPTTCWTPSQADRKHQRSKGQDDGDTSPSFTPVPLSSHEQGRNLQFRAPKDDQPVTAYNTPSTPRRSLRSTRRTPKAVE